MEHGTVTSVTYNEGVVYCSVRAVRLDTEYQDIPVMKPQSGFIQVPKQGETVTLEELDDGTRFISNVISRENGYPDDMEEGELAIQLDDETRVYFEEKQNGDYDLHLDASGDVLSGGEIIGGGFSGDHTDLTNVNSDNHHTRYSDEEAEDAIAALLVGGSHISTTYDDANDELTIDTSALDSEEVDDRVNTLLSAGSNIVKTYDDANDALTLDVSLALGDLSDVTATGEGASGGFDADLLDGNHASAFADSGHTHALGDLSNVTASGEGAGGGLDADLLDGKHAADFVLDSGDTMTGTLTAADSIIVSRGGSGMDSSNSIESNGGWLGIDSNAAGSGVLVGYYNAPEVRIGNGSATISHRGPSDFQNNSVERLDQVFLAEDTNTDINASNYVDWNNTRMNDPAFSFDGRRVTFDEAGTYEIRADADFNATTYRVNPNLFLEYYDGAWNWAGVLGRSGYIRDNNGHNHSSVHAFAIKEVNAGDHIRVRGSQEARSHTVVPDRSQFYIKKLNR